MSRGNGILRTTGSRAKVTKISTNAARICSVGPELYLYSINAIRYYNVIDNVIINCLFLHQISYHIILLLSYYVFVNGISNHSMMML